MKFVDAGVFINLLLRGAEDGISLSYLIGLKEPMAISILAVPSLLREARRSGVQDATIRKLLELCKIIAIEAEDYEWATAYEAGQDFQGALQVSSALRTMCSGFATADEARAKAYEGVFNMEYVASGRMV